MAVPTLAYVRPGAFLEIGERTVDDPLLFGYFDDLFTPLAFLTSTKTVQFSCGLNGGGGEITSDLTDNPSDNPGSDSPEYPLIIAAGQADGLGFQAHGGSEDSYFWNCGIGLSYPERATANGLWRINLGFNAFHNSTEDDPDGAFTVGIGQAGDTHVVIGHIQFLGVEIPLVKNTGDASVGGDVVIKPVGWWGN